MHELAVTESILEIALRHADRAHATQITDLYLVIGDLASIVDDSIQFYWDIISRDTIAEGAVLHFRRVATQLRCLACEQVYQPTDEELACPACGSENVMVVAGEEFRLEAINVENETQPTEAEP
jgi:hydrogenase nickel incorporation protein HypA/HybF